MDEGVPGAGAPGRGVRAAWVRAELTSDTLSTRGRSTPAAPVRPVLLGCGGQVSETSGVTQLR